MMLDELSSMPQRMPRRVLEMLRLAALGVGDGRGRTFANVADF